MYAGVLLAEMNREEVRRLAPDATAVLPIGSIEQHGPHLPLLVDTATCVAICERAAELARAQIPIAVAPALPYGFAQMNFPHPGVFSLAPATFIEVVRQLGECLYRTGFRRIAIINGHRPNDELIRIAARLLNESLPVSVAAASYWTIARRTLVEEAGAGQLRLLPGHAGEFETALTLALRPDLVDLSALPEAVVESAREVTAEEPLEPALYLAGRRMGDNPAGYTDAPAAATAEEGQRYLGAIVRAVSAFLVAFHQQHPER